MKPYGVPRTLDVEFPDLVDIANYGLKSSTGQLKGKGGDYRGSTKTKKRNINRRLWKKVERQNSKREISNEI